MPSRSKLLPALAAALALAVPALAWEPEEETFGRLYRLHTDPKAAEAAVLEAAAAAVPAIPPGPYRAAAQLVQGWRLLRSGKTDDAAAVYESLLADKDAPPALADIARRWLTRLDREKVLTALGQEWTRSIRYPDKLEDLPAPAPPIEDRWGRSWQYKTAPLKRLKADGQTIELLSPVLEADSVLAAALARPWPAEASLRPQRIAPGIGASVVVFTTAGKPTPQTASLSEGRAWSGVTFVKAGPKALLLAEGDYVFLPLKPGNP